jgi:ElaB/YqjD/DUF883 family membrane-anchored ribosome-binding protein
MTHESSSVGNFPDDQEREPSYLSGDGNIKSTVADKLHTVAQTIFQKVNTPGINPELASYGKEASAMLEQSADYIRDFDYDKAAVAVRDYVRKNPGRSLLIAGLSGLVLGAIFRRR